MPKYNRYYFAFGSNILSRRLEERVGKVKVIGTYKLYGYKLTFDCGYPYSIVFANVREDDNDYVEGVLYELKWWQEKILDEFEALYKVTEVRDKRVGADIFFYESRPEYIQYTKRRGKCMLSYINVILDGCLQHKLSKTYNQVLKYKKQNYTLSKGSRHKDIIF